MGLIQKWSAIREKAVSSMGKAINEKPQLLTYEDVLYGENDHSAFFEDGHVIPFKEQSKDAMRLSTGLFPYEQLLLQICERYVISTNRIRFSSKYGMRDEDYLAIVNNMLERGYIQEVDVETRISEQSTVADLKEVLKKNDFPVSGKKADLIKRIIDSISLDSIDSIFPDVFFELTASGKQIASQDRQIILSDRGLGENLNIWNVTLVTGECNTDGECWSIVYDYLQERSNLHKQKNNYGLSRNCKLKQFNIALQLKENADALNALSELILCDLNDIGNNFSRDYIYIHTKYWFPYSTSSAITLLPATAEWLTALKETMELDDDQFADTLLESMENIHIPFRCFTNKECVDICMMEMRKDENGLISLYKNAERRMHKEHPEWFKEPDGHNVTSKDVIEEIKAEYGNYSLDEIKLDLADDDADIGDEVGWILQKALVEIAGKSETVEEFWDKLQKELEQLL